MSYECVLWNNEGTSDKLWGITDYNGSPVSFWGRRTGELRYKLITEKEAYAQQKKKKRDRGYKPTTFDVLEEMQPGFVSNFRHMLTLCILGDGFHRMHD